MGDNRTISVFFVMFMVIVVLAALFSLGRPKEDSRGRLKKDYFWPLLSLASLFGVVALVLVLIK